MNKKRVAINGFGRIGRLVFRILQSKKNVEVVALNDLTSPETLAHLLKYDTAHGSFLKDSIEHTEKGIIVKGREIPVYAERNPADLPWSKLGIDLVVESTGFFVDGEKAALHLKAGAKKVVISAPAKGSFENHPVKTIVYNVNHKIINENDKIISGASCTTNCLAPVAKVLNDNFVIKKGLMCTVHAFTNDQNTQDAPHRDLRRSRAASHSIIPTTTGAAKAVSLVIPELEGKLDGMAMRVPTITGSVVYLVAELEKAPTVAEINSAFSAESNTSLEYNVDEIVSADVIGSTHGSIFDSTLTKKLASGNLYQIVAWYDNELSYVNQLVRTLLYFSEV